MDNIYIFESKIVLTERRGDGKPTEEFVCACAIDAHSAVKHWVRNVESDERFSFWLPTATGYFYPDFVAELNDGRVLVVEYKGEHLLNAATALKNQIGQQWESSSGGKCLFLMAVKDENGRNVETQIAEKIGQSTSQKRDHNLTPPTDKAAPV